MTKLEKIILLLFSGFLLLLLFYPLLFSKSELQSIQLEKAFCLPLKCGFFGFGENGIDLFKHTLTASQTAIFLSLAVCLSCMLLGITLGVVSSLSISTLDHLITLVTNLFLSFPGILLAIALSAFMGQGFLSTWFILFITGWAPFCRLSRAASLQIQNLEYILSAKSIGCSTLWISFKHILPNIFPLMFVQAAFQLSGIIIIESTLSFLGLGLPQETPSLGRLIYVGKQYLISYPHVSLIPGGFILLLVMGFYITGTILNQRTQKQEIFS